MKTLYFVAVDTDRPNGLQLHSRISRPISRASIVRRVLKRIRRDIPHAYAVQEDFYR